MTDERPLPTVVPDPNGSRNDPDGAEEARLHQPLFRLPQVPDAEEGAGFKPGPVLDVPGTGGKIPLRGHAAHARG